MSLLLYVLLPLLFVNLGFSLLSRRRPSAPLMLAQGLLGMGASVLMSLLWLLPAERMRLSSSNGMLQLTIGKSSLLLCLLLDLLVGLALGVCLREYERPMPKTGKRRSLAALPAFILSFALLFLTQGYFWGHEVYGNTTLDQIVFYLNMPLKGASLGFTLSVLHSVLLPSLLCFLPILCLFVLPAKKARGILLFGRVRLPLFPMRVPLPLAYPLLLLWFAVLVVQSNSMLRFDSFLTSYLNASAFIEENYVDPASVSIEFPQNKRNLITVYLESYETTVQDQANGGVLDVNLIPELTQIARDHVSFSRTQGFVGAASAPRCSWTIAALVAQTAGLPLMLYSNSDGSNSDTMLPTVVTLGDILKEQGYNLMFMAGSDFTFGGRRAFYREHGDYQIWDLLTAYEEKRLPTDYYEGWGFEDAKLYEYAQEKILELAAQDQPFHFAMLTVDTHTPGYRCSLCPTDYQHAGAAALNYADTIRCASMQFADFLAWCQQQPFYENTTIVVTGDHPSMQDFFYRNMLGSIEKAEGIDHYVYNAFINAPAAPHQMKDRLFTTMDFFPTTLASLGVQISGDRLGLGTNLFSDVSTLSEQYGEEHLFAELEKKSIFYEERLLYPEDSP